MQPSEEIRETSNTAPDSAEEQQAGMMEAEAPEPSAENENAANPEEEDQTEAVFLAEAETSPSAQQEARDALKAVIEAAIYITDEPLTMDQISQAVDQPVEAVKEILGELVAEYAEPDRGLTVRELAGGYKMGTKPEYHEYIRQFVRRLQPPLKLSLPALETLAVIAYKQPITAPEIMEIRGVQGAGVLKTLLDRKLIATAGRKDVVGKPIMYKTTKEFLVQFGLSSLKELPTLKEFEELGRMALIDEMPEESGSPFEPAASMDSEPEKSSDGESASEQTEQHEENGTASDG
jgi:segregation and condensation protein B